MPVRCRGDRRNSKLQFDRLHVPVLGVVLTKVSPASVDSYFYQERFYTDPPRRRPMPVSAATADGECCWRPGCSQD